jgi:hypothetical protein
VQAQPQGQARAAEAVCSALQRQRQPQHAQHTLAMMRLRPLAMGTPTFHLPMGSTVCRARRGGREWGKAGAGHGHGPQVGEEGQGVCNAAGVAGRTRPGWQPAAGSTHPLVLLVDDISRSDVPGNTCRVGRGKGDEEQARAGRGGPVSEMQHSSRHKTLSGMRGMGAKQPAASSKQYIGRRAARAAHLPPPGPTSRQTAGTRRCQGSHWSGW